MVDEIPKPILSLSDLDEARLGKLNDTVFTVAANGFEYPLRLKLEPGSDRLFVMFHGAIQREQQPLPVFARWNWGKILGGHVIAVCDPTLYLNKEVKIGWFMGTKNHHAIPGLVEIAKQLGEALNIPQGHTLFYGSSGGGYSAILAACQAGPHFGAIAVNPQIEILKYHASHVARLAQAFGTEGKPMDLATLPGSRISAVNAYREAAARRSAPAIVIAQNTTDNFHYQNHYSAFIQALGMNEAGAFDKEKRLGSMQFTAPGGHNSAESKELVHRLRSEAIPFLLEKQKPWWKIAVRRAMAQISLSYR